MTNIGRTEFTPKKESLQQKLRKVFVGVLVISSAVAWALPTIETFAIRSKWDCVDIRTPYAFNIPPGEIRTLYLELHVGQIVGGVNDSYRTRTSSIELKGTNNRIGIGTFTKNTNLFQNLETISTFCID